MAITGSLLASRGTSARRDAVPRMPGSIEAECDCQHQGDGGEHQDPEYLRAMAGVSVVCRAVCDPPLPSLVALGARPRSLIRQRGHVCIVVAQARRVCIALHMPPTSGVREPSGSCPSTGRRSDFLASTELSMRVDVSVKQARRGDDEGHHLDGGCERPRRPAPLTLGANPHLHVEPAVTRTEREPSVGATVGPSIAGPSADCMAWTFGRYSAPNLANRVVQRVSRRGGADTHRMHDVSAHERQFVDALPHVEAVIRHVARRHRLTHDEAEELESRVKLRLLEDDYRLFRVFEGRSSFRTYLTTVVTRLLLDERIRTWGKWRPSSEARRLGPVAITLERLITRDHVPVDEAIASVTSGDPSLDERVLRDILERLPARAASRRPVEEAALESVPAPSPSSDHLVVDAETRGVLKSTRTALHEVLSSLSTRERLMIELRYMQGSRVSDIARVLGEPSKPLYRRFEQLLDSLRAGLEARGVSAEQVNGLFSHAVQDEGDDDSPLRDRSSVSVADGDASRPGEAVTEATWRA